MPTVECPPGPIQSNDGQSTSPRTNQVETGLQDVRPVMPVPGIELVVVSWLSVLATSTAKARWPAYLRCADNSTSVDSRRNHPEGEQDGEGPNGDYPQGDPTGACSDPGQSLGRP